MRKLLTLLAIGSCVVVLALLGRATPVQVAYPVTVPVILDGVRYEPDAFNDLQKTLGDRVAIHYTVLPEEREVMYGFTSIAAIQEFLAARAARLQASSGGKLARPLQSHGCQNHGSAQTAYYHAGYFCGGGFVTTNPYPSGSSSIADLTQYVGMNDAISSFVCAVDGTFTTNCVMWEHINFGGSSYWALYGEYSNDMSFLPTNWDNRVSSIIHYGQASRPSP